MGLGCLLRPTTKATGKCESPCDYALLAPVTSRLGCFCSPLIEIIVGDCPRARAWTGRPRGFQLQALRAKGLFPGTHCSGRLILGFNPWAVQSTVVILGSGGWHCLVTALIQASGAVSVYSDTSGFLRPLVPESGQLSGTFPAKGLHCLIFSLHDPPCLLPLLIISALATLELWLSSHWYSLSPLCCWASTIFCTW
jgi:hypothetical protein